jgi:uncharacterized protein involved in exopolysaccharide biosynthesis
MVAAVALIGAVIGAALGRLAPPRYEATTTFSVAERAGLQTGLRTLEVLLTSNELAEDVVRQFSLDQPPTSLTVASFLRDHVFLEQIRDTSLLRVHVYLPDAKLATDVANGLAAHALELYDRLSARATAGPSPEEVKLVRAQLDEAIAVRDAAEQSLFDFRSEAQIDVLRRDANEQLDARRRLNDVRIALLAERGRLAAAEQELAKQPKTVLMPRQMSTSEALLLLSASPTAENGKGSFVTDLSRNEVVNPVYSQLEAQAATHRATVSALERQEQELATRVKGAASRGGGRELANLRLSLERELASLRLSLEAERGRLASTETQLAKQPRTISIPRRLGTSEALLLSLAGADKGAQGAETIRELTHAEVVNPVYGQLEAQTALLRTSVAAMSAQQQELENQLKLSSSPSLQFADVYRRETQISRLQRALDEASRVVSAASAKYEQVSTATTASLPRPELIDRASQPDQSLSRGMLAGSVAGLLAGFLASLVFVLGRDVMATFMAPKAVALTSLSPAGRQ